MERRCIICGQTPTSNFTYPHDLQQAMKWQNMLATFVPIEILMHRCCICNKHVNRKKETVIETANQEERAVTFTDANDVCYFRDQRPKNQLYNTEIDNVFKSQVYYQNNNESVRSTSGSDLNFRSKKHLTHRNSNSNLNSYKKEKGTLSKKTAKPASSNYGCSSSTTAANNRAMQKTNHGENCAVNSYPVFAVKRSCKQVCQQQKQHQHHQQQQQNCYGQRNNSIQNLSKPKSVEKCFVCNRGSRNQCCENASQINAGNINMGSSMCKPCSLMETGRRPPVNVLIMGGSMVPSYYNNKDLRKRSSDISQICVLESDMTRERAFFPDIDEPNYSVCRQPAEKDKSGETDTTDVLLVGTVPEKKCPCVKAASSSGSTKKSPSPNHPQQPEKRPSVSNNKIGVTPLDELESLLSQQQQLQKSIQAKLNELQAKTNIEKERVNAGNAEFTWPPFEKVSPKVRVLQSMAKYSANY
ncbi:uncharacterized protein LOC111602987 [Drosophila hydei]|uniref:Uncharacterized protein LOC111602987 n=1 Tax=Drosophila hydei TaxID=7224 RepID=A0A6J1MBJ2_DROHY|nr:uncharacterized protein LOC111602987 [Drosophila hydei]